MKKDIIDPAILLMDLPGCVYWKDLKGCYLGCNDFMSAMAGYDSGKGIIGKTDYDLPWREQAAEIQRVDQEVMQSGRPKTLEETAKLANGNLAVYLTTKKPLRNHKQEVIGIFGVSVEITELKVLQEEERQQRLDAQEKNKLANIYLENILENIPEPMYWMNKDSIILGANSVEAKLFGFNSPKEMVGKNIYDFGAILGWDKKVADNLRKNDLEILNTGIEKIIEEQDVSPAGQVRTFITHKAPLFDENKNIIGIVGISVDITDRKKMEEELQIAKEAAESSDRAKSEFIANMSHDVKTPLSGIIGLSEVLTPNMGSPQDAEMIQMIHNGGKQLLHFFENCLEMAKLENGVLNLAEQDFSLQEVLEELKELFLPSIKNKGLNLEVSCDEAIPAMYGSHAGAYRIVLNLLGNAIKFTQTGWVTVNAELDPKAKKDEKIHLIIRVEDTGIGIPAEKVGTIFDRFTRVTPSYKGTYEGHGIGLYIVKKFVTGMGGEISVSSQLNKGTCFTVKLPFAPAKTKKIETPKKVKPSSGSKADAKKKKDVINASEALQTTEAVNQKLEGPSILFVEDNLMAQTVGRLLLVNLGYNVEVSDCALKVLENFEPGKYDFIFMDIGLPDLEGTAVTKHIRKMEKGTKHHVPIVALSAHAAETVQDECLAAGMDGVLSKPLSEEKAQQILDKYVKPPIKPSELLQGPVKAEETAESLAIIEKGANKHMLDMFVRSLPLTKIEIIGSYKAGHWDVFEKAIHKFHGGLYYTSTPQLLKVVQALDAALKNGEMEVVGSLYQEMLTALEAFEQAYRQL